MLMPSLMGRLSFQQSALDQPPLPAGRNSLGISADRDAILHVPAKLAPERLTPGQQVPLLVMFHGAGGFAEKVLPFWEAHAEEHGFLVLAPQSMFPTWDIVVGGHGPDLARLEQALAAVAARYVIDPKHFAFAGFSDGASYALSSGITNGDIASHVIVFSGGFMSVFMQNGQPKVFIAHGLEDEQIPIGRSGRAHADKLKSAGYEVVYVEFNGNHSIQPPVVAMAVDFFLKSE